MKSFLAFVGLILLVFAIVLFVNGSGYAGVVLTGTGILLGIIKNIKNE